MFRRLDPRIRLFAWVALSLLSMLYTRLEATAVLIVIMYLGWYSAGEVRQLVRFTLGLIPFLVIISIISLFPTFDVMRAVQMALRYYVLLGSTMLIMATTSYGEITNALRNLGRGKPRFVNLPLEVFSLVFGLAFLTVPIASEEWQSVKEVQRARGMDLRHGNRIQQVRHGLDLIQPLILRILDRIRHFGMSIITLGYSPFAPRSLYREMALTRTDRVVAIAITSLVAAGIVLRSLVAL